MPKQLQRRCKCNDCEQEWTDVQYVRKDGVYPEPECPNCNNKAEIHERDGINEILSSGRAPAVGARYVSKAADITSRMLEEQYGIPPSLQRDNVKPGESYVKTPSHMTHPQYMGTADTNKQITESFLAQAKSGGTLGESGLNGVEIAKGAVKAGQIPNPLKNMIQMGTKDK